MEAGRGVVALRLLLVVLRRRCPSSPTSRYVVKEELLVRAGSSTRPVVVTGGCVRLAGLRLALLRSPSRDSDDGRERASLLGLT